MTLKTYLELSYLNLCLFAVANEVFKLDMCQPVGAYVTNRTTIL
jgi:hypothetical protein